MTQAGWMNEFKGKVPYGRWPGGLRPERIQGGGQFGVLGVQRNEKASCLLRQYWR